MDLGIALTGVAAASPRASKQPRRWNLRTGAEAEERVATCGLAPCNHAGHSWAGIVPADTNALVELNGSLGAASEAVGSVSFPSLRRLRRLDSSHQRIRARWPGVALLSRVRLYSPQPAGSVTICSNFPTVLSRASRESRQAKRLNDPNKTGPERFLPATCPQ